eukprot:3101888-Rhodomonas_salina.2
MSGPKRSEACWWCDGQTRSTSRLALSRVSFFFPPPPFVLGQCIACHGAAKGVVKRALIPRA